MPIKWKLRKYISNNHSIYKMIELKRKIEKETGIAISTQNLSTYIKKRPKLLNLETIEIICSALQCSLSDIIEITPSKFQKRKKKLSYKNTPNAKKSNNSFPNPSDYGQ